MKSVLARIDPAGRLSIPAQHRRALGLEAGGPVVIKLEGGEVRVRAAADVMAELQAETARLLSGPTPLSTPSLPRGAPRRLARERRWRAPTRTARDAPTRRLKPRVAGSVLDASALLAYLRNEPGGDRVLRAILTGQAVMSTANFAEVATWFARNGADEPFIRSLRDRLVFPLVPLDDPRDPCRPARAPDARFGARPRRPNLPRPRRPFGRARHHRRPPVDRAGRAGRYYARADTLGR